MFKKVIYYVLRRRYFWRHVGFDELSELYTSTMLRSMGLSLVGIFVPIYLYTLGYSVASIFLFMAMLFVGRVISDFPAGYMTALVGPKHTMLTSYFMQIVALLLLLTLPTYNWPLWVIALSWGISLSLFFIAYHVDFSKVMHADHGGKELGFMTIVERMGGVLGPLAGGIVATAFGPRYTIAAAIILFVLAVIPLFLTPEPTKTRQKLWFRHMPIKKLKYDLLSVFALGAENTLAISLWPLYIAIFIFTTNVFANVGIVTSAGVVAAVLTAHVIGKAVDKHQGGELFKWSTYVAAFVHGVRPFIGGSGGVLLANMTSEAATTGFKIPLVKGFYDRADSLPGYRIVYIVWMEFVADIGKTVPWLVLWALTFITSDQLAMQIGFALAAGAALLMTVQRFPVLQR